MVPKNAMTWTNCNSFVQCVATRRAEAICMIMTNRIAVSQSPQRIFVLYVGKSLIFLPQSSIAVHDSIKLPLIEDDGSLNIKMNCGLKNQVHPKRVHMIFLGYD